MIGGYTNTRVHILCLILGTLALIVSVPIPFYQNETYVYIGVWLLLFFGYFKILFNLKRSFASSTNRSHD